MLAFISDSSYNKLWSTIPKVKKRSVVSNAT